MTFQEIVRAIRYLSVRERKMLLNVIVKSLAEDKVYDLPDFGDADAEADETEPQQYIDQPRDDQDYE